MTDDKDFTRFEPQNPQYKKLKNGEFISLNLRITDQNNNIITDGPQVTVSDKSIYLMPPTHHEFKDEQSRTLLFLAHHSSK